MQNLLELIGDVLQDHDDAYALHSSSCGAGASADEHADTQHYPCDMWPLACIVAEETCTRQERYCLEHCTAECLLQIVAEAGDEIVHYYGCAEDCYEAVQAHLCVLQEILNAHLHACHVQQREVYA